jgi:uncharacterized protein YndB with AHSA1/START domain
MIPPLPPDDSTLVLRRTFMAPRSRVFRAWISPRALELWLRPRGKSIRVRSLDARVGGSFHFEMEDGGSIFGTYLNIVPSEKLVFTWLGAMMQDRKSVVTLDFLDQGTATEVVLTHEGLDTPQRRALADGGWPSILDALASVLSSNLDV